MTVECPNHEGSFDCTPFCRICGGEQEYEQESCRCNSLDRRLFQCLDCAACTLCTDEYYMVTDEVWSSVANRGMLCIGCLEARLGRELTASDFTDCPLNISRTVYPKSQRLVARLTP